MKKLLPIIISVVCLVLIVLWQLLTENKNYYFVSVAILVLSMLPLFISFEKSKPSARKLALVSSLTALAVVSRAVFYLVPQVKPIGAVVIVSGICLGAKNGYVIGAFSIFISNFIFGQGTWTPFQMVALGLVGLVSGFVLNKNSNKIIVAVVGFILTFALYGAIVDLSTLLTFTNDLTVNTVLAVYLSSLPFNLTFGISTAVFLLLFGKPFVKKVTRLTTKYGI